jgi:rhamnosyl/mannosyltransferase
MQNLRILHLGKFYPPAPGGIETHVRTLAQAQAALGADVRVYCMNHQGGATAVDRDGPIEVTRFARAASVAKLHFCRDLVGALRKSNADILHLQVPNPSMIVALLQARPKLPMVVTYQSDVIKQRLRALLFRPLERLAYRRAGAILPTSPTYVPGSRFLRRYGEKIEVVPMGIDLTPYRDPSEADRAEAEAIRRRHRGPLWLGCGRLIYSTGFLTAIRALPKVPGTLLIVGDGRDRAELEAEAGRLKVRDRVVFLGAMPYQKVVPYYLAAEAFWFPSNARSEAFGIVQVEAMASGCPVINTSIPHSGVAWVSPHDVSGLTVPMDDPDALAAAANRLVNEPGLRDRLAAAAVRRAAEEFDHRVMAERSLDVYRRVLAGPIRAAGAAPGSQHVGIASMRPV